MPHRREVFCPAYSFCLDAAVEYNRNFSCCSCTQAVRLSRDAVSFEEVLGCAHLVATIFFRKTITRKKESRCPRCGKISTRMGGADASPRRFCPGCATLASEYLADYDSGQAVEIRSGHQLPAGRPLDSEPGVED
jgi:hypothetical protein